MPTDYATLKIHKHNFKKFFKTSIPFDTIGNLYLPGRPSPRTMTKRELGISDSYIQVNYFLLCELLVIANLKINFYKTTESKSAKGALNGLKAWIEIRDTAEKYLQMES